MALGGAHGLGSGARDARDVAPLLRGMRGKKSHPPSCHVVGVPQPDIYPRFCVAGVVHMALGGMLGLGLGARDASDAAQLLRGRRGTNSARHGTYGAGWRAWIWFRPAWRPCDRATSAWQAWHLVTSTRLRNLTSTVLLRGRPETHGTGWRAWTWLRRAWRP